MPAEICTQTCYRIEVSGWDLDQNFFVEKTDLEWSDSDKKVRLRHALNKGAIVFVRLVGESTLESSYPLAYEIVDVNRLHEERTYEIVLEQLHPRPQMRAGAPR